MKNISANRSLFRLVINKKNICKAFEPIMQIFASKKGRHEQLLSCSNFVAIKTHLSL